MVTNDVNTIRRVGCIEEANLGGVGLVGNGDDTKAAVVMGDVSIVPYDVNVPCITRRVKKASLQRVFLVGD